VNADPDFLRELRDDFLHIPRGAAARFSTKRGSLPQGSTTGLNGTALGCCT
jgi:hypothetical protein